MQLFFNLVFILVTYFYLGLSKILLLLPISKEKKKDVLFLAAFFPGNAGYQWRVEKWRELLVQDGLSVDVLHVFNEEELNHCEQNAAAFYLRNLHRRFWQVWHARKYKIVIVRRELLFFNPYGNHFLEKLLKKLSSTLILDFDDDLSASKKEPKEVTSLFGRFMLEDGNSFRNSFHYYDQFIVASNYLKDYVLKYKPIDAELVSIIPTCVDYDKYAPKVYEENHQLVLGWIGGPHNYYLLQNIVPDLNKLAKYHTFELHVIADGNFVADADFPIVNKIWSLENEIDDILKMDIGLMPLDFSEQSKGKGGFKLIQYMGLGVVSCASAVTINTDIVIDGTNSFLVEQNEVWADKLMEMLKQKNNFSEIGHNARLTIVDRFSFKGNRLNYLKMMNK